MWLNNSRRTGPPWSETNWFGTTWRLPVRSVGGWPFVAKADVNMLFPSFASLCRQSSNMSDQEPDQQRLDALKAERKQMRSRTAVHTVKSIENSLCWTALQLKYNRPSTLYFNRLSACIFKIISYVYTPFDLGSPMRPLLPPVEQSID